MKLTKSACDKFKPKEKSYKKFDGGGLYLEVTSRGTKLWRLKFHFQGKEKRLSLGKYPSITLIKAREKREEIKRLLDEGIDPSIDRQNKRIESAYQNKNTFEEIAREWHAKQSGRWSKKRSKTVMQRLEKNVFPLLGTWPITSIKPLNLLNMLRVIEKRGALEVAKRTKQICSGVFRYAIQTGRSEINPVPSLQGALETRKVQHFAAIETNELPELLSVLHANHARLFDRTRNAILFSLLTFCRPGEIRRARWQDIDFDEAQWRIPKEFMKSGKSHIVPLAKQSLELLDRQRQESGHLNTPWVFPARNKIRNPMSDGTVNVALKKLGFHKRMTAHGFRALARTTIREKLKYYPDIIEAQLAHKPMGPLGAAYDRAQFLDERKQMMEDWADYIDSIIMK